MTTRLELAELIIESEKISRDLQYIHRARREHEQWENMPPSNPLYNLGMFNYRLAPKILYYRAYRHRVDSDSEWECGIHQSDKPFPPWDVWVTSGEGEFESLANIIR